jgi:hypothetical protein
MFVVDWMNLFQYEYPASRFKELIEKHNLFGDQTSNNREIGYLVRTSLIGPEIISIGASVCPHISALSPEARMLFCRAIDIKKPIQLLSHRCEEIFAPRRALSELVEEGIATTDISLEKQLTLLTIRELKSVFGRMVEKWSGSRKRKIIQSVTNQVGENEIRRILKRATENDVVFQLKVDKIHRVRQFYKAQKELIYFVDYAEQSAGKEHYTKAVH